MDSPAEFFIADRLRNIPLAGDGARRPASTSAAPPPPPPRTNQVAKRDAKAQEQLLARAGSGAAPNRGRRIQSQSELLFKVGGGAQTASTANLRRRQTAPAATSTMRPAARRRSGAAAAANGRVQVARQLVAATTAPPPTTPTPSAQMVTRPPDRTLVPSTTAAPPPSTTATTTTTSTTTTTTTEQPTTTVAAGGGSSAPLALTDGFKMSTAQMGPDRATSLARAMQTLTTRPLNQRRTQPNVVGGGGQTRGSYTTANKLDGRQFAGENWSLFSKPDGSISLFEVLVLVSNIMIVGTILLVILFGWARAVRQRRRQRRQQQQQQKGDLEAGQTRKSAAGGGESPNLDSANSDRLSKVSLPSSLTSRVTSTTGGAATTTSGAGTELAGGPAAGAAQQVAAAAATTRAAAESLVAKTAQNIQSEFKGVGASLANKAMAIVQPTESSASQAAGRRDADDELKSQKTRAEDATRGERAKNEAAEEAAAAATRPPISRSASDLSRGLSKPTATAALSKDDSAVGSGGANVVTESSRVAALERLFDDEGGVAAAAAAPKARRQSAGSLDSIELPQQLVAGRHAKQPQVASGSAPTPSPNLLLGQVEVAKPREEAAAAPPPPPSDAAQRRRANAERPENPMGRSMESAPQQVAGATAAAPPPAVAKQEDSRGQPPAEKAAPAERPQAQVKSHQIVVNKLDKPRKTNLEIVDLRDESVAAKLGKAADGGADHKDATWISMDGVAVVHTAPSAAAAASTAAQQQQQPAMSPSEIIESRFRVDYKSKRRRPAEGGAAQSAAAPNQVTPINNQDSVDSKAEEFAQNNIETELELDNKLKNRKYFVYIVQDSQFTAKKECIARIELPPKRRITLAEVRQLIANSQDISLPSLRRNKFKFVTETYRLLNENEDAAVLHQVYPTQGVFLKVNIPEQENQLGYHHHQTKGRNSRLSSSGLAGPSSSSSLSQATIASRRRANARADSRTLNTTSGQDGALPAIEVDYAGANSGAGYGRTRASSVGRRQQQQQVAANARAAAARSRPPAVGFGRSKSSVQVSAAGRNNARQQRAAKLASTASNSNLPAIGRYLPPSRRPQQARAPDRQDDELDGASKSLGAAASDLGANMLSGAKRLLSSTFGL